MCFRKIFLFLKNIILLVPSCSVKSLTIFKPAMIIYENYTNVYVKHF